MNIGRSANEVSKYNHVSTTNITSRRKNVPNGGGSSSSSSSSEHRHSIHEMAPSFVREWVSMQNTRDLRLTKLIYTVVQWCVQFTYSNSNKKKWESCVYMYIHTCNIKGRMYMYFIKTF